MAKHISIKLAAAFAIVFIGAAQLLAQSTVTGGINGSIKDPQGGLVPNATVTVTNIGTNNAVTAVTNEDGGFRVSNLQPGTYRVETTVSGFAPARAENVIVEVGRGKRHGRGAGHQHQRQHQLDQHQPNIDQRAAGQWPPCDGFCAADPGFGPRWSIRSDQLSRRFRPAE
jgi:hypothetical protein